MRPFPIATLGILLACGAAHAEALRAVRPLPGYACMQLALTPEQLTDPKVGVPVREAPSRAAPIVGFAANTVIVQDPPQPEAGFLQVLRPTGEVGWIEAGYLRPWSNPFAPSARCSPAIMSNGKPGFGAVH